VIRHKLGSVEDDCSLIDSGIGRGSLGTMMDYSEISPARAVSIRMLRACKESDTHKQSACRYL